MMALDRADAPVVQVVGDSPVEKESDLRILFVIDSLFPGLGGAESQAVKLAQAMNARNLSVEYLAPRVSKDGNTESDVDGIPITYIDYPHVKLLGSVVLMIKFAVFLIRRRGQYHCMHIHITRLLAATAGVVRPITKIPIVTKISGFFEFEGGVLDQRKRLHPVNALMRLAMRNVDYVQTISAETKSKLLDAGFKDSQIALIPNGIDTSQPASPMPDKDVFTIGYCGRLREVKGVHILLDGFAKFRERHPDADVRVLLAGSGNEEDALLAQVKRLGIAKDIEFLGAIEDTTSFYAELDLYVQPSFAEGLPNAVIEAMHSGRAVVATDIGGNQDLVEEGESGYLFPAGDSDKLGELLSKCFTEQGNNVRLGRNGRSVIEAEFGMESVIDQLIGVYRGC